MFWPMRTMKIPALKQNPFPTAWPAWVVQAEEARTLDPLTLLCSDETKPEAKEEFKNRREETGKEVKKEEEKEEGEKEEKEKEEEQQRGEWMEKEEVEEEEGEEKREEEEEEENGWGLLEETEGQGGKERGSSSILVQAATSVTLVAKSTVVSITLPYRPQVGNQHPHDTSAQVTALVSSREFSCGLSSPGSHSPAGVVPTHGDDVLGCPTRASASCSSHWESFPKKELEVNCLPGSTDCQPQTSAPGSPTIPVPALKRPHKRKAATPELQLPSSGLLQLPWDRGDLPPPAKIPRIDTEKESDSRKNMKGQAIQISDGEADALQPENQMVSVHTAPQPVLPSPPPASGPVGFLSLPTDGVSSPGPPASTPLLYQAAGSPILSVSSPFLTANTPTIPISPSALPSEPLPPCRARPSVETPPDAKKGPADLATALASAISHLPRPGPEPLSFKTPSCGRMSPTPMSIAGHPHLPFPATSLAPSLRNPPTVSTMASHACEDMSWEPSSGPAVMDMDTTPPSEAAILSSPTVSSGSCLPFAPSHGCMQQRLVANATAPAGPLTLRVPSHTPIGNNLYTLRSTNGWKQGVSPSDDPGVWIQPELDPALPAIVAITPSHPAMDFEFMDTTPPSKAVILHSSSAADHFSNSLLHESVWGPIKAYNHTNTTSQSTPALLNEPWPNGCIFMRNPSTSTAATGLTSLASQPASGSTTQLGGSTSPVHYGKPNGTVLAYGKCSCASYFAVPSSGFTLNTGMGSGDCSSSSTNFTPSTSALVRPAVPLSGENCTHDKLTPGRVSTPRYVAGQKGKDSRAAVAPIVLKLCCSSAHSGDAVQVEARGVHGSPTALSGSLG